MRIDELRSTLDRHADDAGRDGVDVVSRVRSVHARVDRVRRRRAAAAIGTAVAAAVVAVATLVVPPLTRDAAPQPADGRTPARLAGWEIPRHRTAEGFDYGYVRGIEVTGQDLMVTLPASDQQRTLAWATNSTDPTALVSLKVDGEEVRRSTPGGLEGGPVLYPGDKHRILLRIDKAPRGTKLGLAVFDRSDVLPDGVSNGTSTFRRQIAEDQLVGARISDPGRREFAFDLVLPSTRLRFSDFCSGAGKVAATATTYLNGHEISGAPCDEEPDVDPGAGGSRFAAGTLEGWGLHAGDTVHLRMLLSSKMGSHDTVEAPAAVMGLGVYEVAPPVAVVAGWDVPRLTESDGGTWSYETSAQSEPGAHSLVLRLPASAHDRVVSEAVGEFRNGTIAMYVDGEQVDANDIYTGPSGGSFHVAATLLAGEPHTVRLEVSSGGGPHPLLGLVVSGRVR